MGFIINLNNKKYIAYADILNFGGLPEKIVEHGHHHDPAKVRDEFFLRPIQDTIEKIAKEYLSIKFDMGHDDLVITSDNLDDLFVVLDSLTTIKIPPSAFGFIPLEIALGVIDNTSSYSRIISRGPVIAFLKDDILKPARGHFRLKNPEPKSFVMVTEDLYNLLDELEKKHCEKLHYDKRTLRTMGLEYTQQRARIRLMCDNLGLPVAYRRINDVYVQPVNYENIIQKLFSNRIIFLTGDAESGKTYTAAKLLWEFSERGYEPVYIYGRIGPERIKSGFAIIHLEAGVKPQQIIYFEDPFGKNYYERNEVLERQFANSLAEILKSENTLVVVTSRSEVYKEFRLRQFLNFGRIFRQIHC
jgi:hypothetical protein